MSPINRQAQVGEPDAVISLGLLLLIATPIMRVAASVLLFLAQRDYRYVAITLFVLAVLLISLRGGMAGQPPCSIASGATPLAAGRW